MPDTADELLEEFTKLLGPRGVVAGSDRRPYETDWRGIVRNPAELVLLPASTEEVAAVVRACARRGIAIVPQGGNTGMVAGAVPVPGRRQAIVNLSRLDRIRDVDPVNDTMILEAGVVLQAAQERAASVDRLLPLSLAAEGSCQIGGNVATNAGGVQVLSYGMMRNLVLGLEVVLADGRIWDGLRTVRKDNTGIDLKQLFIGSEGILGIVTAAAVRMVPRPRKTLTAIAAVPSPEAALRVFVAIQERTGTELTSFEYFTAFGMSLVLRHVPAARRPFDGDHAGYVLMELSALDENRDLAATAEGVLVHGFEQGDVLDASIAQSEAQRAAFWGLRENLSEGERAAGGAIKHDVAVPISRIPEAIRAIEAAVGRIAPQARLNLFGHIGDGNLHVNVLPPAGVDLPAFLRGGAEITQAVEATVTEAGGTFSAEHGVGQIRRATLGERRSAVEIELMRAIKRALDPHAILNPGKVLPDA